MRDESTLSVKQKTDVLWPVVTHSNKSSHQTDASGPPCQCHVKMLRMWGKFKKLMLIIDFNRDTTLVSCPVFDVSIHHDRVHTRLTSSLSYARPSPLSLLTPAGTVLSYTGVLFTQVKGDTDLLSCSGLTGLSHIWLGCIFSLEILSSQKQPADCGLVLRVSKVWLWCCCCPEPSSISPLTIRAEGESEGKRWEEGVGTMSPVLPRCGLHCTSELRGVSTSCRGLAASEKNHQLLSVWNKHSALSKSCWFPHRPVAHFLS